MPTRKDPRKIGREAGARSKIRVAGLESVVRKLAAEGLAFREIAQKLATEHGCVVSHVSVKGFIDGHIDERRCRARSIATQESEYHPLTDSWNIASKPKIALRWPGLIAARFPYRFQEMGRL